MEAIAHTLEGKKSVPAITVAITMQGQDVIMITNARAVSAAMMGKTGCAFLVVTKATVVECHASTTPNAGASIADGMAQTESAISEFSY